MTEVPAVSLTGSRGQQKDDHCASIRFLRAVALRVAGAPDVIGAIERSIDQDPRPGRFVLTGSAAIDLADPTWPGTGRIIRLPMGGLTEPFRKSDSPLTADGGSGPRPVDPGPAIAERALPVWIAHCCVTRSAKVSLR